MGRQSAWLKMESLVEQVKIDESLAEIFHHGSAEQKIEALLEKGFTAGDVRVLADGVEALASDGAALGPGWWLW